MFLNNFMVFREFFHCIFFEFSKFFLTIFCIILLDINPNSIFIGYELISDALLWTPAYGQAKAGRPARIYIQQL